MRSLTHQGRESLLIVPSQHELFRVIECVEQNVLVFATVSSPSALAWLTKSGSRPGRECSTCAD